MGAIKTAVFCVILFGETVLFAADLTTLGGEKYQDITVVRVEPDGIAIRHTDGVAKIPFTDLPEEIRRQYGSNPTQSAQFTPPEKAAALQRGAVTPTPSAPVFNSAPTVQVPIDPGAFQKRESPQTAGQREANGLSGTNQVNAARPVIQGLAPIQEAVRQNEDDYTLGFRYYKGDGVPQDYGEAAKWFRRSAEQGNAKAQYSLGLCHEFGLGVPQSYGEAAKWYRKVEERQPAKPDPGPFRPEVLGGERGVEVRIKEIQPQGIIGTGYYWKDSKGRANVERTEPQEVYTYYSDEVYVCMPTNGLANGDIWRGKRLWRCGTYTYGKKTIRQFATSPEAAEAIAMRQSASELLKLK